MRVELGWNVMAHSDPQEGKWRGNWRMEWVASTLHTTSEHGVSSITTADAQTSAASSRLNWRPPTDLNGLVPLAERRNLVSARVPSHFKRGLQFVVGYKLSILQLVLCSTNICFFLIRIGPCCFTCVLGVVCPGCEQPCGHGQSPRALRPRDR
jgi:hypothetical protein